MTKEQKQSDALDAFLNDLLEGRQVEEEAFIENVETIRTALTEHAALKEQVKGLSQTIDSQAMTFNALSKKAKALEDENVQLHKIAKAAAHVGVDCGYGVYELQPDTIALARKLHEEQALKGQDNDTE